MVGFISGLWRCKKADARLAQPAANLANTDLWLPALTVFLCLPLKLRASIAQEFEAEVEKGPDSRNMA